MNKYVFVELKIRMEDYRFYARRVFIEASTESLESQGQYMAKTFYDGECCQDGSEFLFDGGNIAVSVSEIRYISEAEHKIISEFCPAAKFN